MQWGQGVGVPLPARGGLIWGPRHESRWKKRGPEPRRCCWAGAGTLGPRLASQGQRVDAAGEEGPWGDSG